MSADGAPWSVVRDGKVRRADVASGAAVAGVGGAHVDPPVPARGVVARVVRDVLRDGDDRACAQVAPDGILRQHEGRLDDAVVDDRELPAARIQVVGDDDELEPVAAVAGHAPEERVRRGRHVAVPVHELVAAVQEVRAGDGVVLVEDHLCGLRGDRQRPSEREERGLPACVHVDTPRRSWRLQEPGAASHGRDDRAAAAGALLHRGRGAGGRVLDAGARAFAAPGTATSIL
jgi:hypothetical protein